jgi:hypothetical protein
VPCNELQYTVAQAYPCNSVGVMLLHGMSARHWADCCIGNGIIRAVPGKCHRQSSACRPLVPWLIGLLVRSTASGSIVPLLYTKTSKRNSRKGVQLQ